MWDGILNRIVVLHTMDMKLLVFVRLQELGVTVGDVYFQFLLIAFVPIDKYTNIRCD